MMLNSFLKFLNSIKILHWGSKNHSEHKILDDLYNDMSDKIDEYVECFIGFKGTYAAKPTIEGIRCSVDKGNVAAVVALCYQEMRTDITKSIDGNSALSSIVDDMDNIMARTVYLLKMCDNNC